MVSFRVHCIDAMQPVELMVDVNTARVLNLALQTITEDNQQIVFRIVRNAR